MQTLDKAAGLLSHFSESRTEIGLIELARISGNDKASVRRCLLAFIKHGLIEQNPSNKAYRLGPEVLRLSRVREISLPLASITTPILERLRNETGETAHLAILAGNRLATIGVKESELANRISFVLGEESPIHASGTGLAVLAFSSEAQREQLWPESFEKFTKHTPKNKTETRARLEKIRQQGYSLNAELFQPGLSSIGAPLIDASGKVIGAFGIAAPTVRFAASAQKKCAAQLVSAAREASLALGMPKNWNYNEG